MTDHDPDPDELEIPPLTERRVKLIFHWAKHANNALVEGLNPLLQSGIHPNSVWRLTRASILLGCGLDEIARHLADDETDLDAINDTQEEE